jgi:hypothetical protein
MSYVPTQSEMLKRSRSEAALARKKRYQNVVGLALFGAGAFAGIAGMPLEISIGLWVFGAVSWFVLKRV